MFNILQWLFQDMPKPGMNYDYSQRYKKVTKKKLSAAHRRTNGKCCCCGINKSEEVHHSSYRKSGDKYGINFFPVCKYCHKNVCHSSENWIISKTDPVWKNKNTPAFVKTLQRNYRKLHK
jgi:hypothetical protein